MNRKRLAAGTFAAFLLVGGGTAAFAYWTTGGSGAGTAATSTGAAAQFVLDSYTSPNNLAPGIGAQPITAVVRNSHASESYRIDSVTVTITGVTQAVGAVGSCTAADYAIANGVMTDGAGSVAAGATASFTGATLALVETGLNQNGCKGATVALGFAFA